MKGEAITVRGQVQGVGFRPTVWRIATELGLTGHVRNTGDGVEIRLWGAATNCFADRLAAETPALARIDRIDRHPIDGPAPQRFEIEATVGGHMRAAVTPDAATCADCLREIGDRSAHRYCYPFANCTNCGPRFSIIDGAPYDREKTTMRDFVLCPTCRREYEDPADRRFHAEPIACHLCGPRVWIEPLGDGAACNERLSSAEVIDAARDLLMRGWIVAIKGIGGFQLACDATKPEVVARLRTRKRRRRKAFALMAGDLAVVRRYCVVTEQEAELLRGPAAPIVLLRATGEPLANVAPGLDRLGFMLPSTPLHHLLLRGTARPVVMTSGNISGRPQCIGNDEARAQLAEVADFALMHDREIANRIDDSVVRVDLGRSRRLRRARGYAPAPIDLPEGFDRPTQVLALGGELKNTFCLVKDGKAILSQHMGDLEDASTTEDVTRNLALYRRLYEHDCQLIAVDRHPEYLSTKRGQELASQTGVPIVHVQHHHAHIAACMAENGWPLDGGPVLGIAMDGLGFGDDGTIWGGEFLACDYVGFRRLASLKPVALPGGGAAVREPWRNAYAHLMSDMRWDEFARDFRPLDLFARFEAAPRATLDAMISRGLNSPLASSCGRLFDAAAAMCGLAWGAQDYEGEAAMCFEATVEAGALAEPEALAYPFGIAYRDGRSMPHVEPGPVWRALLGDLRSKTPVGVIAARFHRGLARAIVTMAVRLSGGCRTLSTVALSGGCFQNGTLFALVHEGLESHGLKVLSHHEVPTNDGGLALGQALVALATRQHIAGSRQCA